MFHEEGNHSKKGIQQNSVETIMSGKRPRHGKLNLYAKLTSCGLYREIYENGGKKKKLPNHPH